MTIEDRVRRLLTDAVADEPPPPRRPPPGRPPPPPPPPGPGRRGRPGRAGPGRRGRRGRVRRPDKVLPATPTLTTLPTTGWPKRYDEAGQLQLPATHQAGSCASGDQGGWNLTPPGARPQRQTSIRGSPSVSASPAGGYYIGGTSASGDRVSSPAAGTPPRWPGLPATVSEPPRSGPTPSTGAASDRGVPAPGSCRHAQSSTSRSPDRRRSPALGPPPGRGRDGRRHPRAAAPGTASGGGPHPASLPRRPVAGWSIPGGWADGGGPSAPWSSRSGSSSLGGQPCHLRPRLSMAVEQDGRLLPLPGNPAPARRG